MTERESRETSQNQFGRRGNKAQTAKVRRIFLNYSSNEILWSGSEIFLTHVNRKRSATGCHCEKEIIHYVRPTCDNSEGETENVR